MTRIQQTAMQLTEQSNGMFIWQNTTPFHFESGATLAPWQLAFETYGELNAAKNNVILIHHALSTSSHLAAHEKNPTKGWWEAVVGANKAIDTNKFFVICINNLGSCFGSSGPASINPVTKKPYRRDFPAITMTDMVRSQALLLNYLGIEKLYALIGNSMGAMLSLTWAMEFPEQVKHFVSVSSCFKAYPVSIATHAMQREMITMDLAWQDGYYQTNPTHGFNIARKFGLLSYRNPNELNATFYEKDSLIRYLDYNASKFTASFDANCYLYIFEAMDRFDVTAGYDDPIEPFKKIRAKTLVVSVASDLLFPPQQQRDLYDHLISAGVTAHYVTDDSAYGHDAFYADEKISKHIRYFLESKI